MKNEILPEGTQLITTKLTVISMYNDRFGKGCIETLSPYTLKWEKGFSLYYIDVRVDLIFETLEKLNIIEGTKRAEKWRVTVPKEDTALLSDTAIPKDLCLMTWPLNNNSFRSGMIMDDMSFDTGGIIVTKGAWDDKLIIQKRYYPHANATLPVITAKDFDEILVGGCYGN